MSMPLPKPALLNDDQLAKVRSLESEIGDSVAVVAYTKTLQPADLSDEQLARIRQLEEEMGVYLVAWKKPDMVCE